MVEDEETYARQMVGQDNPMHNTPAFPEKKKQKKRGLRTYLDGPLTKLGTQGVEVKVSVYFVGCEVYNKLLFPVHPFLAIIIS